MTERADDRPEEENESYESENLGTKGVYEVPSLGYRLRDEKVQRVKEIWVR